MAILGKNWQSIGPTTAAIAAGGAVGQKFAAYQHSLLTTPDIVIPILKSFDDSKVNPNLPAYTPIQAYGANASQVTIGFLFGSVVSCPNSYFDLFAGYFHSIIR